MVIRGRIENGVVVFDQDVSLPNGTEVTVIVRASDEEPAAERMSDEEHQRMIQEMERIAALPIEGRRDPFGGADHDNALYGNP